jgi:hypothetical protein
MANPTIYDVARAAGVGIGTVSRVLINTLVSPETQEKVLRAIRVLGYRRSKAARQLSTGVQHRNIGAIMPFITHPSFVERLRGMQLALNHQDNDFNLVLYNVSEPDRYHEQLLAIVERRSRWLADCDIKRIGWAAGFTDPGWRPICHAERCIRRAQVLTRQHSWWLSGNATFAGSWTPPRCLRR